MASANTDRQPPTITPGPGPVRENRPLTKIKKSSTACLPCKKAKRKCTGKPAPCRACHTTGDDCVFNEQLDLRRKVAVQKTAGDLDHYRRLLSSLLECLRTANDEKVSLMLQTIRGGGDVASNIRALSKMLLVEGPPIEVASDASDSASGYNTLCNPPSRISVGRLCDKPMFQVPCKPWTTTTDDDHLVSSLMSLYFTWDHPLMQVVNQEIFLRDMSARDLASEFCTPVLVNSILAVASIYSNYPETYAVPGDAITRGQNFFMEAEGRWRAEEGRPSLANIQALTLMSHNLKLQGKDNVSWLYLRQAVQLGQDIGIFKFPRSRHCEWDRMPERVKRTSAQTAWAVIILNLDMCLEHGRMANIDVPGLSPDEIYGAEQDTIWVPYCPRSNHIDLPSKPAFLHYVLAGLADLTKILVDIQGLFFGKARGISIHQVWVEASQLYNRVEAFRTSLQHPATLDDQPTPQILFLHIKCHHIVISLLGLVLELQDFESALGSVITEEINLKRIHAVKQVVLYLQLYRKYYTLPQTPSLFFGPAKTSSFTLLASLDNLSTDVTFRQLHQFLLSFGMGLSDLPPEIILIVLDSIIAGDLKDLCFVSKKFCAIAQPLLYHEIILSTPLSLLLLCRTIVTCPLIAAHIRSLDIDMDTTGVIVPCPQDTVDPANQRGFSAADIRHLKAEAQNLDLGDFDLPEPSSWTTETIVPCMLLISRSLNLKRLNIKLEPRGLFILTRLTQTQNSTRPSPLGNLVSLYIGCLPGRDGDEIDIKDIIRFLSVLHLRDLEIDDYSTSGRNTMDVADIPLGSLSVSTILLSCRTVKAPEIISILANSTRELDAFYYGQHDSQSKQIVPEQIYSLLSCQRQSLRVLQLSFLDNLHVDSPIFQGSQFGSLQDFISLECLTLDQVYFSDSPQLPASLKYLAIQNCQFPVAKLLAYLAGLVLSNQLPSLDSVLLHCSDFHPGRMLDLPQRGATDILFDEACQNLQKVFTGTSISLRLEPNLLDKTAQGYGAAYEYGRPGLFWPFIHLKMATYL